MGFIISNPLVGIYLEVKYVRASGQFIMHFTGWFVKYCIYVLFVLFLSRDTSRQKSRNFNADEYNSCTIIYIL